MNSTFRIAIVLLVIVSLVAGCATTGENTSGRVIGTTIGAVTGALIGANKHGTKGALAGALIGGTAGFAAGWLVDGYRAKKTKTAQQVREQYGVPSRGYTVPEYNLAISPTATVPRGEKVDIVSTFAISGPDNYPLKVAEVLTISKPDGTVLITKRQEYNYKDVDGPGEYEFSQPFHVQQGIDQGYCSVSSTLYINGKTAGNRNSNIQVVRRGSVRVIASR